MLAGTTKSGSPTHLLLKTDLLRDHKDQSLTSLSALQTLRKADRTGIAMTQVDLAQASDARGQARLVS